MHALQPYLLLAERLGSRYAQAGQGGGDRIEVEFAGGLARHDISYLTAEAIKGMLAPFTEDRINVVNARMLAEARGIEVVERRSSERGEYPDLLTLRVSGKSGDFTAAATVLPMGPRLVR